MNVAKTANEIYNDWMGNDMSPEAQAVARQVKNIDDLYARFEPDAGSDDDDILSSGEFDAIEAALTHG